MKSAEIDQLGSLEPQRLAWLHTAVAILSNAQTSIVLDCQFPSQSRWRITRRSYRTICRNLAE